MTVTLSKRTEEIVQTQLKDGSLDEVVNRLIEERLSNEDSPAITWLDGPPRILRLRFLFSCFWLASLRDR